MQDDAGCGMRDAGCRMRDAGCGTQAAWPGTQCWPTWLGKSGSWAATCSVIEKSDSSSWPRRVLAPRRALRADLMFGLGM